MLQQTQFQVTEADPMTVRRWLDAGEAVLIDVRETAEYDQEYIAGALLAPLSTLRADLFPRIPDKKVVVYCAIGQRSAAAIMQLTMAGLPTATKPAQAMG